MKNKSILIIVIILGLIILANPSLSDFKEFMPTSLQIINERGDNLVGEIEHTEAIKKNNFGLFSIYEYQYISIDKIRTKDYGTMDKYGTFNENKMFYSRKYIGFMKNFFIFSNSESDWEKVSTKDPKEKIDWGAVSVDKDLPSIDDLNKDLPSPEEVLGKKNMTSLILLKSCPPLPKGATLLPEEELQLPPKKTLQSTGTIQCTSITKKGSQCKRITKSSNGKCWQHGGN